MVNSQCKKVQETSIYNTSNAFKYTDSIIIVIIKMCKIMDLKILLHKPRCYIIESGMEVNSQFTSIKQDSGWIQKKDITGTFHCLLSRLVMQTYVKNLFQVSLFLLAFTRDRAGFRMDSERKV